MMLRNVARHLAPNPSRQAPCGAGVDAVVGFADPRLSWLNKPEDWALPADGTYKRTTAASGGGVISP